MNDVDFIIFSLTDAPDAPSDLTIEKYDKASVDLTWKKPEFDGGNPIKGKLSTEINTARCNWHSKC